MCLRRSHKLQQLEHLEIERQSLIDWQVVLLQRELKGYGQRQLETCSAVKH